MKDYIKNIQDAERRFFTEPVDFEMREDKADENVISGYAAVFNSDSKDFGGWHERIAPGAFDDVINDDAVALFNHDMNLVLGRNKVNVTLSQDKKGLKYRVELPDTTFAKDVRTLIKDKIIHQSSFAFTVAEQRWEHKEKEPSVRTITKIKRLYDVSPVTNPAYEDSTVGARNFEAAKPKDEPRISAEVYEIELKLKTV
ncbi:MAG TPA: HK97 family phage prohead protease [Cyclobacteriaceae bacterium]